MTSFAVKHPRVALVVAMSILGLCCAGLRHLQISADARVFFSKSNTHYKSLETLERRYASDTNLIIALNAHRESIFKKPTLDVIRAITERAWALPYAKRVESISNALHISSADDTIFIDEAISSEVSENPTLARSRVINDSLLVDRLISPDGRTTAVIVTFDYSEAMRPVTEQIMDSARDMIASLVPGNAEFEIWYGGRVATSAAFSRSAKFDMAVLSPLGYVLMLALLTLIFRSLGAAISLFLVGLFASIGTLGFAGWTGIQVSAATSTAPTIIIALSVAALMHVVWAVKGYRRDGAGTQQSVEMALRTNTTPLCLTLGTTTLGFLTLNFADAPPIRDLGNLVALGTTLCLIFGYLLLPVNLLVVKFRRIHDPSCITPIVKYAARLVRVRHTALVCLVPVILILPVFPLASITLDDNFNEYFDSRYQYRQDSDNIERHLTGLDIVEFDLRGEKENAVFGPQYIKKLEQFENWVGVQSKVVFINSIAEVFRRLNQHVLGGDPQFHRIPYDAGQLAQYLLMYELSLPLGHSLSDTVTIDRSGSRVSVILKDAKSSDIIAFKRDSEAWMASHSPTSIFGTATGLSVMYAYVTSINVESMVGGSVTALALISLLLIFAFRSVKYGIISLVPNLFPVVAAFGVWSLLVGEVGVAVSVVGVITLGIIVDDTIHMMWRYSEARRSGLGPEDAIESVFEIVGEPMITSTLALLIGFAVVSCSGFLVSSAMGMLSAITIVIALLADWFVLAPLLVFIDRNWAAKTSENTAVERH